MYLHQMGQAPWGSPGRPVPCLSDVIPGHDRVIWVELQENNRLPDPGME